MGALDRTVGEDNVSRQLGAGEIKCGLVRTDVRVRCIEIQRSISGVDRKVVAVGKVLGYDNRRARKRNRICARRTFFNRNTVLCALDIGVGNGCNNTGTVSDHTYGVENIVAVIDHGGGLLGFTGITADVEVFSVILRGGVRLAYGKTVRFKGDGGFSVSGDQDRLVRSVRTENVKTVVLNDKTVDIHGSARDLHRGGLGGLATRRALAVHVFNHDIARALNKSGSGLLLQVARLKLVARCARRLQILYKVGSIVFSVGNIAERYSVINLKRSVGARLKTGDQNVTVHHLEGSARCNGEGILCAVLVIGHGIAGKVERNVLSLDDGDRRRAKRDIGTELDRQGRTVGFGTLDGRLKRLGACNRYCTVGRIALRKRGNNEERSEKCKNEHEKCDSCNLFHGESS